MPKQNYLEFRSKLVSSPSTPQSFEASVLVSSMEDVAQKVTKIVVDEVDLPCNQDTIRTVAKALHRVQALEKRGQKVDCNGLAILLAGGTILDKPRKVSPAQTVLRELVHGSAEPVSQAKPANPLQPVILGTLVPDGRMKPSHAHSMLLPDRDIWIEKLGIYSIALAGQAPIADFFNATHSAQAYSILETHGEYPAIRYVSDQIPAGEPTFRLSSMLSS